MGFFAAAPEIMVSLTAMEAPPNLKRTPYDLYLFLGDLSGEALARNAIFRVCALVWAERPKSPQGLRDMPCIPDTSRSDDWAAWARAAMPDRAFTPRGPVFSRYSLAVEETVNGAGILMGHELLVAPI